MKTLLVLLALVVPLQAQTPFTVGDLIVSGLRETRDEEGFPTFVATIRVYGRDGELKRELVTSSTHTFTEPYVRDGVVFVGAGFPSTIERFDSAGNALGTFTTEVTNVSYLSPGPDGGLIATNASGELFAFAADGRRVRYRDFLQHPPTHAGVDLGADRCTVVFGSNERLAKYDVCRDTPGASFTAPFGGASTGLRILPDGTFLVGLFNRVVHLAEDGAILRAYGVPSNQAIALDVDGTSFWTNAGNILLRIDIATGAVLSQTYTDASIRGISIVGEPRAGAATTASPAAIPAVSEGMLIFLAVMLAVAAAAKLR